MVEDEPEQVIFDHNTDLDDNQINRQSSFIEETDVIVEQDIHHHHYNGTFEKSTSEEHRDETHLMRSVRPSLLKLHAFHQERGLHSCEGQRDQDKHHIEHC
jgi:hypothetical protein